ncbi:MAG TPA: class F sortase [Kribbella sp.]
MSTPKRTTTPRKPNLNPVLRSVPSVRSSGPSSIEGQRRSVPMRKSTPIRVVIPAIGVDSVLMRLGLKSNGNLQVPPNGFPAGWFTGGPTPGEKGPAVIAGHVRWSGRTGVFAALSRLKPGDKVTVTRQDRSAAVFRVIQVKQYPKSSFPSGAVYGDLDHAGLRLITCGGLDNGRFEANLVVFADLMT